MLSNAPENWYSSDGISEFPWSTLHNERRRCDPPPLNVSLLGCGESLGGRRFSGADLA